MTIINIATIAILLCFAICCFFIAVFSLKELTYDLTMYYEKNMMYIKTKKAAETAEREKDLRIYSEKWKSTELYMRVAESCIKGIRLTLDALSDKISYKDAKTGDFVFRLHVSQRNIFMHTTILSKREFIYAKGLFDYVDSFGLGEYKDLTDNQREAFINAIEADIVPKIAPDVKCFRHDAYTLLFNLESYRKYTERKSII